MIGESTPLPTPQLRVLIFQHEAPKAAAPVQAAAGNPPQASRTQVGLQNKKINPKLLANSILSSFGTFMLRECWGHPAKKPLHEQPGSNQTTLKPPSESTIVASKWREMVSITFQVGDLLVYLFWGSIFSTQPQRPARHARQRPPLQPLRSAGNPGRSTKGIAPS